MDTVNLIVIGDIFPKKMDHFLSKGKRKGFLIKRFWICLRMLIFLYATLKEH